jgi:hypothetical protein
LASLLGRVTVGGLDASAVVRCAVGGLAVAAARTVHW